MDAGQLPTPEHPLAVRILWPELAPDDDVPLDNESAIIAERRAKCFRLYTRGLSVRRIADEIGTARKTTVAEDVRFVLDSFRLIVLQDATAHVVREVSRLAMVEAEALEAWERSKGDFLEMTSEDGDKGKYRMKEKERDGNPVFLKLYLECWDRRCKLLGLLKQEDFSKGKGVPPVKLVAGFDPAEHV